MAPLRPFDAFPGNWREPRAAITSVIALIGIAVLYFALAKIGLAMASINPSASPIWPPTGFALAAALLFGLRIWPAVFIAAFLVNVTTAGSTATSLAIALGNTLECLVSATLINRWSEGLRTFDTPTGVARFAALSLAPGALISATLGVGSLVVAGFAPAADFGKIWLTWWLGDAAGAIMLTPAIVLWITAPPRSPSRNDVAELAAIFAVAFAVGVIAFSPLIEQSAVRGPISFLAVLPLLLTALRRGPRDTAVVALILTCFAVWGTLMDSGPFARTTLNDSFLLLLAFIISITVPSLVLSAAHEVLDSRVLRRTADLAHAVEALQSEVEERKEIETELREQRVHLMEAQRMAVLGSWSWDLASNKVAWSQQLFNIYGTKPEDFRGTFEDFLARIHEDDRKRVEAEITSAFQSGRPFRLDERIVRPDGEIRFLQSSGEVIRDDRGNVVRMLGICQDVTERKRAEIALHDAREQLAQSQKLEALGQLTGGIAHDFNNLLMIVSGHAQILRRGLADEKQTRSLDAIASATSRGENLTRQLLAFSRRQPLSPVVVDLRQRIEAVREMLGSSLRGNIELVVDMPDGLWPTKVDLGELELALVNTAVNARDAMPDGGRITLSARNVALKRGGPAGDLEGDFVALTMTDTGSGIPRDVLPRVFEPFFTTKAVGKGTGLGLSQVYGFAQQTGGGVTLASEPGQGTAITLYLPRSRDAVDEQFDAASAQQPWLPGEGRILVVEDNPAVAEVTGTLLTELGYAVVCVDSAAAALDHLNRQRVDLVFSDVVMPGTMNGIALADEIATRHPGIPVLLTSGYSESVEGLDGRAVLRKPFQGDALGRQVRDMILRSRRGGQRASMTIASTS